MRKEIENWWLQAKNDLKKAEVLFKSTYFDGCAFFCQQSVEKSLKSFILSKTRVKSFEGHSLIALGKTAGVPESFYPGLKKLSPHYFLSRYPDVTEDVPYELYDQKNTLELLHLARGIVRWISQQIE